MYATFDESISGRREFQVRLTQNRQVVTSTNDFCLGFQCNSLFISFPAHLRIEVVAPDRVRRGQAVKVTVNYENDGEVDMPAPLLVVDANNALIRHPEQPGILSRTFQFLATSPSGPAGVLPPNSPRALASPRSPGPRHTGSIQLLVIPQEDGDVHIDVLQVDREARIDWNAAKDTLRPPDVPADAWDVIFAHFTASVAPVVSDVHEYEGALARAATYLSQLGEYTHDVARLLALELARAGDFGAIAQRYRLGALGRGFPDPTDIGVATDFGGDVNIRIAGRVRSFFRNPKGYFLPLGGDPGRLTLVDGAYRLREADGSVTAFCPDGKLDFVEDTNGNRITAEYDNGRMTGLVDSFGNRVPYAFDARGRISQITDAVGQVTRLGTTPRTISSP